MSFPWHDDERIIKVDTKMDQHTYVCKYVHMYKYILGAHMNLLAEENMPWLCHFMHVTSQKHACHIFKRINAAQFWNQIQIAWRSIPQNTSFLGMWIKELTTLNEFKQFTIKCNVLVWWSGIILQKCVIFRNNLK